MISAGELSAQKIGRDWLVEQKSVDRRRRLSDRRGGRPWSSDRAAAFLADVDAGRRGFSELEAHLPRLRHRPSGSLAAQWLDLVEAGKSAAADEIMYRLIRRYSGRRPLAELALTIGSPESLNWTAVRAWADHIAEHPEALAVSVADKPPASGSGRIDNLLAAIAEREAHLAGMSAPAWVSDIEPLIEPWTVRGTPRMIESERRLAPPEFLARGIHLGRHSVWRQR